MITQDNSIVKSFIELYNKYKDEKKPSVSKKSKDERAKAKKKNKHISKGSDFIHSIYFSDHFFII